jgi:hypothetical protein
MLVYLLAVCSRSEQGIRRKTITILLVMPWIVILYAVAMLVIDKKVLNKYEKQWKVPQLVGETPSLVIYKSKRVFKIFPVL